MIRSIPDMPAPGSAPRRRPALGAAAAAIAAIAVAASPALADPVTGHGKPVTPRQSDIVGTSDITTSFLLDQLSASYNAAHPRSASLYSWDALSPADGTAAGLITARQGCRRYPRPYGLTAQTQALLDDGYRDKFGAFRYCYTYATALLPANQPRTLARGKLLLLPLANEVISWATPPGSNAPRNLTPADLHGIYSCTDTSWLKFPGGKRGTIEPQLPPRGSAIRTIFLTAIHIRAPGKCVQNQPQPGRCHPTTCATSPAASPSPAENAKNVIVPVSVAAYITLKNYQAKPLWWNRQWPPIWWPCWDGDGCFRPPPPRCLFPCPFPPGSTGGTPPVTQVQVRNGIQYQVNKKMPRQFVGTVYAIIRYDPSTADHIPASLEPIFGASGWLCTNKAARHGILSNGDNPNPSPWYTTQHCGAGRST